MQLWVNVSEKQNRLPLPKTSTKDDKKGNTVAIE